MSFQYTYKEFELNSYRFGFNGMERDDEVKGQGNSYDFKFRIYDSRIAKFLSVDSIASSIPYYTTYQFAGNSPIKYKDFEGKEPLDYLENWKRGQSGLTQLEGDEVFEVFDQITQKTWSVMNEKNSNNYYYLTLLSIIVI